MKKLNPIFSLLVLLCISLGTTAWASDADGLVSRLVAMKQQASRMRAQGMDTSDLDRQIRTLSAQWVAQQPARAPHSTLDQGNDVCPGTPITSLPYNDSGTTIGMGMDFNPCLAFDAVSPDVMYTLTVPACALITVDLCGSSFDTGLEIRAGGACPGDVSILCNDDGPECGVSSWGQFEAAPGVTYYIIVHGLFSSEGDYVINVFDEPCPIGRCCYVDDGELACASGVSAAYCADLGGNFVLGETCETMPCPAVGNCGPMDLVFVIDTTGSMGSAIDNVKAELPYIAALATAASGGDLRLGLVTFGDQVHTTYGLTNNIPAVLASINLLTANGGGNWPECSDEALREVITMDAACTDGSEFTTAFRPFASKLIVLVTDAENGGCDDAYTSGVDDVNAHLRALAAAAGGIRISAVFVPTGGDPNNTIVPVLQDYASTSSGAYHMANANGSGTGAAINEIIANCGQGEVELDGRGSELHCDGGILYGNPATVSVRVINSGTATCGEAQLSLSNGAGPGGTGNVLSMNPINIPALNPGDTLYFNFTVQITPSADSGCVYFTAELISRECPRAFIDNICVYVPHCMDCRFPYDLVDMGDLMRCNYPTLVNNPGHGLSGIAWLGEGVTSDVFPNVFNQDGADDGVRFVDLPWHPCQWEEVWVQVTAGPNYERYLACGGHLYLNAWKDGNMDGDFCDELCDGTVSEWIIADLPVTPGVHQIPVQDPGVFDMGNYDGIFRFRLTSQPIGRFGYGGPDAMACPLCTCPGTIAMDFLGEVEDYFIPDAQLDVELANYSAEPGENGIALRWTTASETDNNFFEIERNNVVVAHIASQGNTSSGHDYAWTDSDVQAGTEYSYRLVAVDLEGTRRVLATRTAAAPGSATSVVKEYALMQNYPNPFNPTTSITFDVAETGNVEITVFDVMGKEVARLVNGQMGQGRHTISFDAQNLPAGMYLYRMTAGSFSATHKMLLIK